MISIPEEIIDAIEHDSEGNMVLSESATQKQKEIFNQFKRDLETGDTSIEFEI